METVEKIKQGFKFLKNDCSDVLLAGFVSKDEIPVNASKEEFEDEDFSHEYSDTRSDGWDECNFWGNIYLPLNDELYMNFEVHA